MIDKPEGKKRYTGINNANEFASLLAHPDSKVWELIFDSLPDMVALIDVNNIVVKANKSILSNLKIGDRGIVGLHCFNLMHENGCMTENCPHLSVIKDQKPHSIELFEPRFNAYLHIITTPIFDENNNLLGSLHIARDITTQKKSEEKLQEYNNELKELNLSKDKFFSIVAHDLRSPFQGMLGFTDLILDELDTLSKEEIREYLLKVRDSSYSTFTLLENLLNWSRLQTGKLKFSPSDFSLYEGVAAIISLLNTNAQSKNISLINNVPHNSNINADQKMMHSILLNLTTNAIKFTNSGGNITIDAKVKPLCQDNPDAGKQCSHKCLEISVSDTGIGLSPESIERLFKTENQISVAGTHNEQGAGLGLMLVKEMTERHGGTLKVSSEEGKGSVFSFTIPLELHG